MATNEDDSHYGPTFDDLDIEGLMNELQQEEDLGTITDHAKSPTTIEQKFTRYISLNVQNPVYIIPYSPSHIIILTTDQIAYHTNQFELSRDYFYKLIRHKEVHTFLCALYSFKIKNTPEVITKLFLSSTIAKHHFHDLYALSIQKSNHNMNIPLESLVSISYTQEYYDKTYKSSNNSTEMDDILSQTSPNMSSAIPPTLSDIESFIILNDLPMAGQIDCNEPSPHPLSHIFPPLSLLSYALPYTCHGYIHSQRYYDEISYAPKNMEMTEIDDKLNTSDDFEFSINTPGILTTINSIIMDQHNNDQISAQNIMLLFKSFTSTQLPAMIPYLTQLYTKSIVSITKNTLKDKKLQKGAETDSKTELLNYKAKIKGLLKTVSEFVKKIDRDVENNVDNDSCTSSSPQHSSYYTSTVSMCNAALTMDCPEICAIIMASIFSSLNSDFKMMVQTVTDIYHKKNRDVSKILQQQDKNATFSTLPSSLLLDIVETGNYYFLSPHYLSTQITSSTISTTSLFYPCFTAQQKTHNMAFLLSTLDISDIPHNPITRTSIFLPLFTHFEEEMNRALIGQELTRQLDKKALVHTYLTYLHTTISTSSHDTILYTITSLLCYFIIKYQRRNTGSLFPPQLSLTQVSQNNANRNDDDDDDDDHDDNNNNKKNDDDNVNPFFSVSLMDYIVNKFVINADSSKHINPTSLFEHFSDEYFTYYNTQKSYLKEITRRIKHQEPICDFNIDISTIHELYQPFHTRLDYDFIARMIPPLPDNLFSKKTAVIVTNVSSHSGSASAANNSYNTTHWLLHLLLSMGNSYISLAFLMYLSKKKSDIALNIDTMSDTKHTTDNTGLLILSPFYHTHHVRQYNLEHSSLIKPASASTNTLLFKSNQHLSLDKPHLMNNTAFIIYKDFRMSLEITKNPPKSDDPEKKQVSQGSMEITTITERMKQLLSILLYYKKTNTGNQIALHIPILYYLSHCFCNGTLFKPNTGIFNIADENSSTPMFITSPQTSVTSPQTSVTSPQTSVNNATKPTLTHLLPVIPPPTHYIFPISSFTLHEIGTRKHLFSSFVNISRNAFRYHMGPPRPRPPPPPPKPNETTRDLYLEQKRQEERLAIPPYANELFLDPQVICSRFLRTYGEFARESDHYYNYSSDGNPIIDYRDVIKALFPFGTKIVPNDFSHLIGTTHTTHGNFITVFNHQVMSGTHDPRSFLNILFPIAHQHILASMPYFVLPIDYLLVYHDYIALSLFKKEISKRVPALTQNPPSISQYPCSNLIQFNHVTVSDHVRGLLKTHGDDAFYTTLEQYSTPEQLMDDFFHSHEHQRFLSLLLDFFHSNMTNLNRTILTTLPPCSSPLQRIIKVKVSEKVKNGTILYSLPQYQMVETENIHQAHGYYQEAIELPLQSVLLVIGLFLSTKATFVYNHKNNGQLSLIGINTDKFYEDLLINDIFPYVSDDIYIKWAQICKSILINQNKQTVITEFR